MFGSTFVPAGGGGGGASIGASVYSSVSQVLANNAAVTLTFDTINRDALGMFNIAFPTRLTCKVPGIYLVVIYATWTPNAAGIRSCAPQKNGITLFGDQQLQANGAAGSGTYFGIPAIVSLIVGDYIEVITFQNSGAALNTYVLAPYAPGMSVQKIG